MRINSVMWLESNNLFNNLILFYFKQKSAYEMRSSDWSSDVCSSDLVVAFDVRGRVATGFVPHAARASASRAGVMRCIGGAPSWIGSGEIGRASCRERVC